MMQWVREGKIMFNTVNEDCFWTVPKQTHCGGRGRGRDPDMSDVMQLQMSHTLKTARAYYGREANHLFDLESVDSRTMSLFMNASKEWQGDIGILVGILHSIHYTNQIQFKATLPSG